LSLVASNSPTATKRYLRIRSVPPVKQNLKHNHHLRSNFFWNSLFSKKSSWSTILTLNAQKESTATMATSITITFCLTALLATVHAFPSEPLQLSSHLSHEQYSGHSFVHVALRVPPQITPVPSITNYYYYSTSSTQLPAFSIKSIFHSTESTSEFSTSSLSPTQKSSSSTNPPSINVRSLLSTASVQATSSTSRKIKSISEFLSSLQWPASSARQEGIRDAAITWFSNYWWTLPLFLALVPPYTTFVLGSGDAIMPRWWPCTKMDHTLAAPDAFTVIGCFLVSNIAYFASGIYLVSKYPFVRANATSNVDTMNGSRNTLNVLKAKAAKLSILPTRRTWLGVLVLLSGLISTIFHTEQALGSYALANSLCYIDHAIAGTCTFYFFHTLERPTKRVWALGLAGLACLSIPSPAYAWLHSSWHLLSAAAATVWAVESNATIPTCTFCSSS